MMSFLFGSPARDAQPKPVEPDTEPRQVQRRLFEEEEEEEDEAEKLPTTCRKRGRPQSKKKKRPPTLALFNGRGRVTPEGWGYIRCFVESHLEVCSWRDFEAIFDVPVATLRFHMGQELGDATLAKAVVCGAPSDADARAKIMEQIIASNKLASLSEIRASLRDQGVNVSRQTVWRDLYDAGFALRARPIVPWTGGNSKEWRRCRVRFARQWYGTDCRRLMFCDECIFRAVDGRTVQWCRADENPQAREEHRWAATCHCWGIIGVGFRALVNLTDGGTGPRGGVTGEDYLAFLSQHFLPKLRRHQQRHPSTTFLFVQDGARIHTSPPVLALLRSWGLEVFSKEEWPPHSPDLNPIENMWGISKKGIDPEVRGDQSASLENKAYLCSCIEDFFSSYPVENVDKLVLSWTRRLKRVIELKGAYTGY